ncbi:MAG: hypothetical protein HY519_04020, partial [Candidatus Aenigmarchaeota archaeon]|nr:hypothetical protein [Candidatus Aenigmarchaeota archaeon]
PTQVQYPSPEYLFYLFYKMSVGVDISTLIAYQPVFLAVFPLAAAALLGGLHFAYARNKPLLFLCLALASTVATALLFSLVLRPIFYFRYFSFLIPFMALLQAYGFGQLKDRRVAALGYLLLFAGQLGLDLLYYQLSATGEWGNLIGL